MHQTGPYRQVVRAARDRVAVEAQQVGGSVDRMCDQTAHHGLQGVEAVRERRRDAEVAAATSKRPEEVWVRVGPDVEFLTVCGDEFDSDQVVRCETVLGHQPAEAAAKGVAGDARGRDRASGHREPVLCGSVVQLRPEHAALRACRSRVGIDLDPLHFGEVDHHPAVRDGAARDVMTATANRNLKPTPARKSERRGDVTRRPAADDHSRPPVDQAVVDRTSSVIAGVTRFKDRPGDLSGELGDQGGIQRDGHAPTSRSVMAYNSRSSLRRSSPTPQNALLRQRIPHPWELRCAECRRDGYRARVAHAARCAGQNR